MLITTVLDMTLNHSSKVLSIRDSGFSLIEVLITVLITSVGLMALAALQARALQDSHSSLQRTVAMVQANDLAERLWAGRCATGANADEVPFFPTAIYNDWRTENIDLSDGGSPLLRGWTAGASLGGSAPNFNVTISWVDHRARDNAHPPSFSFSFGVPTSACPPSSP